MTANLSTIACDKLPAVLFLTLILNDPAPMVFGITVYPPIVPTLSCCKWTTSVAATVLLVTVNVTIVAAAKAAPFIVMVPHSLFIVTPVDLLVAWVTVPPAPVA